MAIDFRRVLSVGQVLLRQVSTPSAPAAGTVALYAKSDAEIYAQTPAGVEHQVSAIADPRWYHQEILFPNPGDITSASYVDLVTATAISVPVWAQDGSAFAEISFRLTAAFITASSDFNLRVVAGSTNGTASDFQAASGTAMTGEAGIHYTIPASTTSLTYKLQGLRAAGTGALRISTSGKAVAVTSVLIHR
jgi:hypothetical protein